MSRPKKKERRYTIREDVVNDIKNNPEKYQKPRKLLPVIPQEFSNKLKSFKEDKFSMTCLDLLLSTGVDLDVVIPLIRGKEINPLGLNLTDKQLHILYSFLKKLLQNAITFDEFQNLLNGKSDNAQYKVKKNRTIAILFKKLQENGYIDTDWQKTLEKIKAFASRNSKPLKASDYAKALLEVRDDNRGMRKDLQDIDDLIKNIKKAGE